MLLEILLTAIYFYSEDEESSLRNNKRQLEKKLSLLESGKKSLELEVHALKAEKLLLQKDVDDLKIQKSTLQSHVEECKTQLDSQALIRHLSDTSSFGDQTDTSKDTVLETEAPNGAPSKRASSVLQQQQPKIAHRISIVAVVKESTTEDETPSLPKFDPRQSNSCGKNDSTRSASISKSDEALTSNGSITEHSTTTVNSTDSIPKVTEKAMRVAATDIRRMSASLEPSEMAKAKRAPKRFKFLSKKKETKKGLRCISTLNMF
jgi:hypothetical protein